MLIILNCKEISGSHTQIHNSERKLREWITTKKSDMKLSLVIGQLCCNLWEIWHFVNILHFYDQKVIIVLSEVIFISQNYYIISSFNSRKNTDIDEESVYLRYRWLSRDYFIILKTIIHCSISSIRTHFFFSTNIRKWEWRKILEISIKIKDNNLHLLRKIFWNILKVCILVHDTVSMKQHHHHKASL